jgi:hypothetical protein
MWRCGASLPNIVVAWKLEIVNCEQCYWWCATYAWLYHFEGRCMCRISEVHAMSKEELPQGVVKFTPIVALDALNLATELSGDKRKELSDSQQGVRLQTQSKSPRVVQKIVKNDKTIFRARDVNNRRCPNM